MLAPAGRRRAARAVGIVATGAALSAACAGVAPREVVQQQIVARLGVQSATCPGGLPGAVGSTITCRATGGGEAFDVTVTVTAAQGEDLAVQIERVGASGPMTSAPPVDPAVGAVAGPQVAAAVSEQLTASAGQEPDRVTCPDLPVGHPVRARGRRRHARCHGDHHGRAGGPRGVRRARRRCAVLTRRRWLGSPPCRGRTVDEGCLDRAAGA